MIEKDITWALIEIDTVKANKSNGVDYNRLKLYAIFDLKLNDNKSSKQET